ncbi:hypothetical protein KSF_052620 [Reticulibacter mediterranei]|uniref:Uncharacterized protein n=1 Tax=Reticulibacter mediterranei TaxID=2778369 RepID=A0A8J3N1K7_9CHLR|nr:hypothetical protein [Reticulibacter mediterranei]GHO95214.1 hypothetical protein KSF_052620 [Reticulibacter mediterranei]
MIQKKKSPKKIRSILPNPNHNLRQEYTEFPKDENGILYVRQSTLAQFQNNIHSFEMQTDKFVEHFRNRGCTGHIEVVTDDEGLSGTMDIHDMPGMSYVMKAIEGKALVDGKKISWIGAIDVKRLTRDKWLVKPGTLMRACYENDVWISTLFLFKLTEQKRATDLAKGRSTE